MCQLDDLAHDRHPIGAMCIDRYLASAIHSDLTGLWDCGASYRAHGRLDRTDFSAGVRPMSSTHDNDPTAPQPVVPQTPSWQAPASPAAESVTAPHVDAPAPGVSQPVSGPSGAATTPIWAAGAPAGPVGGVDGGQPSAPARSSRLKLGIVAAVSAVIVIGGGVAVAQAASDSGSGQSQSGGPGGGRGGGQGFPGGGQGAPGAQNGQNAQGGQAGQGGFPGGGFARGGNVISGALHGDFVVKGSDGQYVTQRLQTGTVTAVSATSITAKSEDGHATTFVVGADTKVDNGASKIGDVKAGDTVTVIGLVSGDTATATTITDTALMRQRNGNNGGGNGQRQASPRPTQTT
ncbi:hypothetical protein ACQP00_26105 [Dactylosporangium sp. CS-047395]|uniref:hypothetical protein n=1 Tax=Dactylosporangium sp. CS-047395 TaxID=3239936 RepID=UPI003D8A63AC